jgi:hypothetical protein
MLAYVNTGAGAPQLLPSVFAKGVTHPRIPPRQVAYIIRIRQHTSAYVSIRQHTSAYVSIPPRQVAYIISICQHTSAYASIRQHTPAYTPDRSLILYTLYILLVIIIIIFIIVSRTPRALAY